MSSSLSTRPIGIFDSGIGGLTVVRAMMEHLPHENILYFGDTARVPYGVKSVETIRHFTTQITDELLMRGVKMLIIACNTMAAVAGDIVRTKAALHQIPVLDVIEAGAQAAIKSSTQNIIGVIATPTTVNANAYAQRIHALSPNTRVISQACPLFVPLVEEGWLDHPVTRLTAQEYLKPLLAEEIDTLVLGCTHYPLLKPLLRDIIGPSVRIVDSATTTAQAAAKSLLSNQQIHTASQAGQYQFIVTDTPLRFQTIGERFLGRAFSGISQHHWPA